MHYEDYIRTMNAYEDEKTLIINEKFNLLNLQDNLINYTKKPQHATDKRTGHVYDVLWIQERIEYIDKRVEELKQALDTSTNIGSSANTM